MKRKIDIAGRDQISLYDLIGDIEMSERTTDRKAPILKADADVRRMLTDTLKSSPYDRNVIAERMSDLLGRQITKAQLDSWSAESKETHKFPLAYLPALIVAAEDKTLIRMISRRCDGYFIESEDALRLELVKLEDAEQDIRKRKKDLKSFFERRRKFNP